MNFSSALAEGSYEKSEGERERKALTRQDTYVESNAGAYPRGSHVLAENPDNKTFQRIGVYSQARSAFQLSSLENFSTTIIQLSALYLTVTRNYYSFIINYVRNYKGSPSKNFF